MKAKIPVTERALIQRINRKLAKNGSKLVAARGAKEMEAFGHYYTVRRVKSALNAQVLASHLDLVGYGRELGVLATDEEIVGWSYRPGDERDDIDETRVTALRRAMR